MFPSGISPNAHAFCLSPDSTCSNFMFMVDLKIAVEKRQEFVKLAFNFRFYQPLALCPQAIYFSTLNLSFLIYKMG